MLTKKQITAFLEDGYLIVPGLFTENEISPIVESCHDLNILDKHASSNEDFSGNESFRAAFWRDPNGSTLLAKLPVMPRLAEASAQLLQADVYYWRSRLVFKKPHEAGRIEFHQDFSFWYQDGCIFPDMLSCTVAVTPATRENGCLEVLKGSHRVGRLDLDGHTDGAEYPKSSHVDKISERCERIYCELEPGDGIFFHGNTIHGSGPNETSKPRILIHSTYNAEHNVPIVPVGQSEILSTAQGFEPMVMTDDDFIVNGDYKGVFDHSTFFPAETSDDNPVGIFKRKSKPRAEKSAV